VIQLLDAPRWPNYSQTNNGVKTVYWNPFGDSRGLHRERIPFYRHEDLSITHQAPMEASTATAKHSRTANSRIAAGRAGASGSVSLRRFRLCNAISKPIECLGGVRRPTQQLDKLRVPRKLAIIDNPDM
jgi:hypothetical protein